MTLATRTRFGFGAVALTAAALAGCGSGGSSSTTASAPVSSTTASTAASTTSGSGAVVATSDNSDVGQTILVDGQGMTLYLFEKDSGGQSQCNGNCASDWPPYVTKGSPSAGTGASDSMLGTTKRSDGTTQVTYAGHPLYHYAGDQQAGDANGNGLDEFGAEWYALQPNGDNAEGKS